MPRNFDSAQFEANRTKLPLFAATRLPSDESPIIVKFGEIGYWPLEGCTVEQFNEIHGVSLAQAAAMLNGSMFGWDIPAADPDNAINVKEECE